jgi:hypothetical protein
VVDIIVHHKGMGYLNGGYEEKITKYSPLLPVLADHYRVNPVVVTSGGGDLRGDP